MQPLLFLERAVARVDHVALIVEPRIATTPVVWRIPANKGAVRRRQLELVGAADKDADLAKHEDIYLLARVLKLEG